MIGSGERGIDDLDASSGEPLATRLGQRRSDGRDDRPDRDARDVGERDRLAGEQAAQEDSELVGGARDIGHDAPVRAKLGPVEQPERRLGVPHVEGQEHGSGSAKVRVPVRCRATRRRPTDEKLARRSDAINDAA